VYNDERPHEALRLKPPVSAYAPSSRRYPRALESFDDEDAEFRIQVDRDGYIRWRRRRVFISTALAHELVCVDADDDELDAERWIVRWGAIVLGWIDNRRLSRGLILPVRPRRR